MIYFDNAATGGFKPYNVTEAVTAAIKYLSVNPTRSGHRQAKAGGDIVFKARQLLKETFGSKYIERVIFTKNCTEALDTAIFGILKEGDHVVATCMEHNSVLRPIKRMMDEKGVTADFVFPQKAAYISQDPLILYSDIKPLIRENTRLVITNHISNVTGSSADVGEIGRALKRDFPNIIYMVDGAQSGGHVGIDMERDGIDVLCLAGHKGLGGITGSGALIFNDCDISPLMCGGTGTDSFSLNQPDYYPERLESGTLSLPAIISLYEGLIYTRQNMETGSARLADMTSVLISALTGLKGVKVYSLPNPAGIVSFSVARIPSEECAEILSEKYSIAVRGGFHCAPLMHEYLGTQNHGLVRASLGFQNTYSEIDKFVSAISEISKTP